VRGFLLHPEYLDVIQGVVHDVGALILDKPARDIAPARLAGTGFLDDLAASGMLRDATFVVVGYGADENMQLPGDRRMAVSSYVNLLASQLYLSANPHKGDGGQCYGDSDGPALYFDGMSEVIVATASYTTNPDCASVVSDYRIDTADSQAFVLGAIAAYP